jgi:hypothetical protein
MFHPMMPWALGSRLQRRRILACSILLAVLACAALPGVSEASRKLRGHGFSTNVPTDWKVDKTRKNGSTRTYSASSPQTKRNVTANSTLVSVVVIPVPDFERQAGRRIPSSLVELLGAVMGAPPQAQNARITASFRSATLGGRPAAAGAAQYSLGGATVLQSDTVSVYRGHVYIVQFYVDIALQYQGLTTLSRVHRHWRWR